VNNAQSKLLVRPFVAEWDYPVFASWVRAHGREDVPQWALPEVGFVVYEYAESQPFRVRSSVRPLACAFGYQDNKCGLVTWLTARPGLGPRTALAACSLVVAAVERELERRGVRFMISPSERPSLVKLMRRRGWGVLHAANVLLYKMLDGERSVTAANDCEALGVADPFIASAASADAAAKEKGGAR